MEDQPAPPEQGEVKATAELDCGSTMLAESILTDPPQLSTIEESEPALPPPYIDSNPTHIDTLLTEALATEEHHIYSPFAVVPEPSRESLDTAEDFPPFRVVPPADTISKGSSDMEHKETEPETMQSEFATVADAIESITPHGPEAVSEQSDNEASPKLKQSRPQKRSRGSTSIQPPKQDPDETEPERSQPKMASKKRRTLPAVSSDASESSFVVPAVSPTLGEMSLMDLPDGWRLPQVYFVTEQQDKTWGRAWKQLPDRRVSTGAVYLSAISSGTPGLEEHMDGPTCILRDLCSLVQDPNDEPTLHERSYVSLSRASIRETISLSGRNAVQFELGVTKVIKASAEREYFQPVPLDVICECLVAQLEAMMKHSHKFPSHLFAQEMTIWQYAPILSLHTKRANLRAGLIHLLEAFALPAGLEAIAGLSKVHNVRIASKTAAGSRRRTDRAVGSNLTYVMPSEEEALVKTVCDSVREKLNKIKTQSVPAPLAIETPAYSAGQVIVEKLSVLCLPRSSTALRDRILRKLSVTEPIQIPFVESMADDAAAFKTLANNLLREDNKWLNNFQHAVFLDLTLSAEQEKWIMSTDRVFQEAPCPPTPSDLVLIQSAIKLADDDFNVTLKVDVPEAKIVQDVCSIHRVNVSMVATKDISVNEPIKLSEGFSTISWATLINDAPETPMM